MDVVQPGFEHCSILSISSADIGKVGGDTEDDGHGGVYKKGAVEGELDGLSDYNITSAVGEESDDARGANGYLGSGKETGNRANGEAPAISVVSTGDTFWNVRGHESQDGGAVGHMRRSMSGSPRGRMI